VWMQRNHGMFSGHWKHFSNSWKTLFIVREASSIRAMENLMATPVPLVIFGVPFHNVTLEEAINWIVKRAHEGRSTNVVTANLDFITRAWDDPELHRILIEADLVIAEGLPIVRLAPFFGPSLRGRITGSELTPMLAEHAAREGVSVYSLGGAGDVAEKAMQILRKRYPDLKVAGTWSPPYSTLMEMNHTEIVWITETGEVHQYA